MPGWEVEGEGGVVLPAVAGADDDGGDAARDGAVPRRPLLVQAARRLVGHPRY